MMSGTESGNRTKNTKN